MDGRGLREFLFILLVYATVANPLSTICYDAGTCEPLEEKQISKENITIRCEVVAFDNCSRQIKSSEQNTQNTSSSEEFNVTSCSTESTHCTSNLYSWNYTLLELTPEALFENQNLFSKVKYLNCSGNSITNLIGDFGSLIYIDASYNAISNISTRQFNSPKLAHLDLRNNNVDSLCHFSHITLQSFNAAANKLTSLCLGALPKLKSLSLGNNLISRIESNLSTNVPLLEILNLSSNAITKLNDYNFNLNSLLHLYLGNNKISYLSEKCFYGLSKLQVLDISDNQITTVFPSMFQYLPLVQLVVSNNPNFATQDFGILLASERLKSVNASGINQVKITACLTRTVRYLSLSHNSIGQIQCGDLDSYPLLNSLDLSYNNISFIEDDALGRLELLETIILSHNQLTYIPYTLPSNLKSLSLNDNHLSRITITDFAGLLKLSELDLSNSNVNFIQDGSFSQMYGLQKLNLSMNPIEVVSIATFSGPHKLKILDLSGLENVTKCNQDLCFPVPDPNELSELYVKGSSELGNRLVNDAAALKTFKQVTNLNLESCNLSFVPNDMPSYFPRLRYLYLNGNGLNCSKIHELYEWSDITEEAECTFSINEELATTAATVVTTHFVTTEGSSSPTQLTSQSTEVSLDKYVKNNTLHYAQETEVVSNEIMTQELRVGEADAFSTDTPSSHPGLFVMLLVPVTLAGAVIFINYSRLKRKIRVEKRCEMSIEISNISSELW